MSKPKRENMVNVPISVFVNMTDIILGISSGSGLRISNVISTVLLQSVFITGNLNGAVEIHHSNVTFSGITTLTHNKGKPFYITNSNVTFKGSFYFERNNADSTFTFEEADGSKLTFPKYTSFYQNYGRQGIFCISPGSNVTFRGSRTEFIKNRSYKTGAIYARHSYLNFHGNITISESVAYRGGGLSLCSGAIMIVYHNAYINFTGNRALSKGGAIYVHDKDYYRYKYSGTQCFFCLKMRA